MNSYHILIVDSEEDQCENLRFKLLSEGFQVDVTYSAEEALLKNFQDYNIVLTEVMLNEISGFKMAHIIRSNPLIASTPIIFLTTRDSENDRLTGFSLGADDYITKPFSIEELLYRIEAILRRSTSSTPIKKEGSYTIGVYSFDPLKQLLVFDEQVRKLTTKESELLELLCRYRNEILERNFALKTIWIDDNYFNARSMDVYITRLRKYFRKDPTIKILNIHGRGYKLIN